MVLIISQSYTGSFGSKTKNIINMGVVEDMKVFEDEENLITICASSQGIIDKFICKVTTEERAMDTIQAIYNAHVDKEPSQLMDVNGFIPRDFETDNPTIEEIEDLMLQILIHHGYNKIVDIHEKLICELDDKSIRRPLPQETTLDQFINTSGETQSISIPANIHMTKLREFQ